FLSTTLRAHGNPPWAVLAHPSPCRARTRIGFATCGRVGSNVGVMVRHTRTALSLTTRITSDTHDPMSGGEGHGSSDGHHSVCHDPHSFLGVGNPACVQKNAGVAIILLGVIIFFSILLEKFVHWLQHVITCPQMRKIVNRSFEELMIMGFISMVIFFLNTTGILQSLNGSLAPEETLHFYEFFHYVVFFTMIYFIFVTMLLIFMGTVIPKWLLKMKKGDAEVEAEKLNDEIEQEEADEQRQSQASNERAVCEILSNASVTSMTSFHRSAELHHCNSSIDIGTLSRSYMVLRQRYWALPWWQRWSPRRLFRSFRVFKFLAYEICKDRSGYIYKDPVQMERLFNVEPPRDDRGAIIDHEPMEYARYYELCTRNLLYHVSHLHYSAFVVLVAIAILPTAEPKFDHTIFVCVGGILLLINVALLYKVVIILAGIVDDRLRVITSDELEQLMEDYCACRRMERNVPTRLKIRGLFNAVRWIVRMRNFSKRQKQLHCHDHHFWFQNPKLLPRVFQFTTISQAFYLVWLTMVELRTSRDAEPQTITIMVLLPVISLFVVMPLTLPPLVLVTSLTGLFVEINEKKIVKRKIEYKPSKHHMVDVRRLQQLKSPQAKSPRVADVDDVQPPLHGPRQHYRQGPPQRLRFRHEDKIVKKATLPPGGHGSAAAHGGGHHNVCHDPHSFLGVGNPNCVQKNASVAILLLAAIVFFSILMEKFVHWLQHRIRCPQMRKIINRTFEELMIMGFLSMFIAFLNTFKILDMINPSDTLPPEVSLHFYEFFHYVVFFTMIYFIVVTLLLIFMGTVMPKYLWKLKVGDAQAEADQLAEEAEQEEAASPVAVKAMSDQQIMNEMISSSSMMSVVHQKSTLQRTKSSGVDLVTLSRGYMALRNLHRQQSFCQRMAPAKQFRMFRMFKFLAYQICRSRSGYIYKNAYKMELLFGVEPRRDELGNMVPTKPMEYGRYHELCTRNLLYHISHLHYSAFLVLLAIAILPTVDPKYDHTIFVCVGVGLLLINVILLLKVISILRGIVDDRLGVITSGELEHLMATYKQARRENKRATPLQKFRGVAITVRWIVRLRRYAFGKKQLHCHDHHFWFKSPRLLPALFQFTTISQAFYLVWLTLVELRTSRDAEPYTIIAMILLPLISLLFIMPLTLPALVLVTSLTGLFVEMNEEHVGMSGGEAATASSGHGSAAGAHESVCHNPHAFLGVGNAECVRANAATAIVLLALIIIFSLLLEKLVHWVQHKLCCPQMRKIVNRMFEELMIMGFLSMGIFFLNTTNTLAKLQLGGSLTDMERLHFYEFFHYIVFFTMIYFIVIVLLLLFIGTVMPKYLWSLKHGEMEEEGRALTSQVIEEEAELQEANVYTHDQLVRDLLARHSGNRTLACPAWAEIDLTTLSKAYMELREKCLALPWWRRYQLHRQVRKFRVFKFLAYQICQDQTGYIYKNPHAMERYFGVTQERDEMGQIIPQTEPMRYWRFHELCTRNVLYHLSHLHYTAFFVLVAIAILPALRPQYDHAIFIGIGVVLLIIELIIFAKVLHVLFSLVDDRLRVVTSKEIRPLMELYRQSRRLNLPVPAGRKFRGVVQAVRWIVRMRMSALDHHQLHSHNHFFWFGKPKILPALFQFATIGQAFYLVWLTMVELPMIGGSVKREAGVVFVMILLPVLSLLVITPLVLPPMVLILSLTGMFIEKNSEALGHEAVKSWQITANAMRGKYIEAQKSKIHLQVDAATATPATIKDVPTATQLSPTAAYKPMETPSQYV
ncbi:TPA: hypothetical protein N0F65_003475, partial [Lagenidium giganteum]